MLKALILAAATAVTPAPVPADDYAVYDRVLASKFLTSQTESVMISAETATTLGPLAPGKPVSRALFAEHAFFEGQLPLPLITDFILKNQQAGRLVRRFNFGVSYRLISPDGREPIVFHRIQAPPVVGLLTFSRVAYSQRGDEALVYVAEQRPDGTGAGMLVWLRREKADWIAWDTEVIWTIQADVPEEAQEEPPR